MDKNSVKQYYTTHTKEKHKVVDGDMKLKAVFTNIEMHERIANQKNEDLYKNLNASGIEDNLKENISGINPNEPEKTIVLSNFKLDCDIAELEKEMPGFGTFFGWSCGVVSGASISAVGYGLINNEFAQMFGNTVGNAFKSVAESAPWLGYALMAAGAVLTIYSAYKLIKNICKRVDCKRRVAELNSMIKSKVEPSGLNINLNNDNSSNSSSKENSLIELNLNGQP